MLRDYTAQDWIPTPHSSCCYDHLPLFSPCRRLLSCGSEVAGVEDTGTLSPTLRCSARAGAGDGPTRASACSSFSCTTAFSTETLNTQVTAEAGRPLCLHLASTAVLLLLRHFRLVHCSCGYYKGTKHYSALQCRRLFGGALAAAASEQLGAHLCPAGWPQTATAPSRWACSAGGAGHHPPAASCQSPARCAAVATAQTCRAQQTIPWTGPRQPLSTVSLSACSGVLQRHQHSSAGQQG